MSLWQEITFGKEAGKMSRKEIAWSREERICDCRDYIIHFHQVVITGK